MSIHKYILLEINTMGAVFLSLSLIIKCGTLVKGICWTTCLSSAVCRLCGVIHQLVHQRGYQVATITNHQSEVDFWTLPGSFTAVAIYMLFLWSNLLMF